MDLASACSQGLVFRRYDAENGLPSSEVYKVFRDHQGFIWFCTDRGISKYNSYTFETVDTKENNGEKVFFDGYCDKNGICWFLSMKNNYYYYDGKNLVPYAYNTLINKIYLGKTLSYKSEESNGDVFELGNIVQAFAVISVRNNKVDTLELSDHILTSEHKSVLLKLRYNKNETNHPIMTIKFSKDLTNEHFYFDQKNAIGYLYINLDYQYGTGALPIRTHIHRCDSNFCALSFNNKLYLLGKKDHSMVKIGDETVYRNFQDVAISGQDVYFGFLSHGMYVYNMLSKKITKMPDFENLTVTSILKDPENNLWVSTTEKGVFFIPSLQIKSFTSVDFNVKSVKKVGNDLIIGLKNGELGYFDAGMQYHVIGNTTGSLAAIEAVSANKVAVQSIILPVQPGKRQFNNSSVKDLAWYKGDLFGISTSSLFRIDLIKNNGVNPILGIPFRAYCLLPLSKFKFLIGAENGLLSYDTSTQKLTNLNVTNSRINQIQPFKQYIILATLGDGIYIYDKASNKILQKIQVAQGLSSNFINRIKPEGDSVLWVATNIGLNRISIFPNWKLRNIIYFDRSNGLPSNEVNNLDLEGNELYVATVKGLGVLDITRFHNYHFRYKPIVKVTKINIAGQSNNFIQNKSFQYYENNLIFGFSAFINSKTLTQYTYKYAILYNDGTDTIWNNTNETELQFTNLKPGNYVLLLKAQSRFGGFGPISAQSFNIIPHFTQTTWFKALIIAIIVIILALIPILGIRNFKSRENLKRKIKEAQLDALRNQMNPHFIFNALNSIQSFIFRNDAEKANYFLGSFSKIFRDSLEYSNKSQISVREEISFLKRYLEIEKLRFKDKLEFTIDCDISVDQDATELPPLLMQPLVENSVKHGLKFIEGKGLIQINLVMKDNMLEYSVRDNGMGFQKNRNPDHISRGTQIIQNRIAILNQTYKFSKPAVFEIINYPGKGVFSIIKLPKELVTDHH